MSEGRRQGDELVQLGFLQDDIGFQIHQARRAVRLTLRDRREQGEERARSAIPPSGTISTIILIGLNPGISQHEIAETLFLDGSKVAMLVKQLEAERHVEKRRSPDDARRFQLYLTHSGEAMLSSVRENHKGQSKQIASKLTKEECAQLVKLLLKVQRRRD